MNKRSEVQERKFIQAASVVADIASLSAVVAAVGATAGALIPPIGIGVGTLAGVAIGAVISRSSIGENFGRHSKQLQKKPLNLSKQLQTQVLLNGTTAFLSMLHEYPNVTVSMLEKSISAYAHGKNIVEVLLEDGVESDTASVIEEAIKKYVKDSLSQ